MSGRRPGTRFNEKGHRPRFTPGEALDRTVPRDKRAIRYNLQESVPAIRPFLQDDPRVIRDNCVLVGVSMPDNVTPVTTANARPRGHNSPPVRVAARAYGNGRGPARARARGARPRRVGTSASWHARHAVSSARCWSEPVRSARPGGPRVMLVDPSRPLPTALKFWLCNFPAGFRPFALSRPEYLQAGHRPAEKFRSDWFSALLSR
jgi:hypothetical protein